VVVSSAGGSRVVSGLGVQAALRVADSVSVRAPGGLGVGESGSADVEGPSLLAERLGPVLDVSFPRLGGHLT